MKTLSDNQLVKIIDEYIKSSDHEEYYKIVKSFIPVEIIDELTYANRIWESDTNTFKLFKTNLPITSMTFELAKVNKRIYILAIDELRKRC